MCLAKFGNGSYQTIGVHTKSLLFQKSSVLNKSLLFQKSSVYAKSLLFQAYELSTLTGTQVMLLVASETGHVYTFATPKLQPMITSGNFIFLSVFLTNNPVFYS